MVKYRLKKEFIYENEDLKNEQLYLKALELGYTFVKDGNDYRIIKIKEFKTKGDELNVELIKAEIVQGDK
ncbi:hypothetical protein [Clostridium botulinum]|uniref:Uncharacterized protein n=1 Tax=Clostridium botulinum CFSAN001627 TaxID=1232189 RepID=M1ZSZ9_CLOBO|nr:hypothetical protein [Clostridium botulinum]EKN42932.1 hypothetical protein CFSAN001627_03395 [Clostridium botulinum CFSAN001627]APC82168.1 hypothetical protein NPD12_3819 [Clostridium botulinum]AXG97789.1 hypothetical protein AGE31_19565 [Clostridium botulinum]MBY6773565.1 hypothetical protein [Clostridium botulinum]MBY6850405.1 hypothetical protein [Clostridium botulinum]